MSFCSDFKIFSCSLPMKYPIYIVTESHVAAYSALAEREHLCYERYRVVIPNVEDGQRDTHIHVVGREGIERE